MSLKKMKISDPWIAMEPFDYILDVKSKVDYKKWVEFIESHSEYFSWLENTEKGKKTLSQIDLVPASFKENVLIAHNKLKALAELNKSGYHEVIIHFNNKTGTIGSTFQKKITKKDLTLLLEMANYLDALLLNNGDEIIDKEYIESLPE